MDILESVKIVFYFSLAVLVLSMLPLVYQLYHIILNARRISDRVEMLSDIKGWAGFFKNLYRYFKP